MLLHMDTFKYSKTCTGAFLYFLNVMSEQNLLIRLRLSNLALPIHRSQMVMQSYSQGRYPLHFAIASLSSDVQQLAV